MDDMLGNTLVEFMRNLRQTESQKMTKQAVRICVNVTRTILSRNVCIEMELDLTTLGLG